MDISRTQIDIDAGTNKTADKKDPGTYEFYDRLSTMHRIFRAIGSTLDLDSILIKVVQELSSLLQAGHATLFLVDEDEGVLWSKVLLEGQNLEDIRMPLGEGIAGWVAATGRPVNIQNHIPIPASMPALISPAV